MRDEIVKAARHGKCYIFETSPEDLLFAAWRTIMSDAKSTFVMMKIREGDQLGDRIGQLLIENEQYFAVAAPGCIGSIGADAKILLLQSELKEIRTPDRETRLFRYGAEILQY